jgi:diguanylate cyclase (GGDEF)-like protein/PAS domain S-box-containing protein
MAKIEHLTFLGFDAEELFRALAEHTAVGVFVSNVAGETVFVNERWCELTGLTSDQAIGDGWRAALHAEDAARVAPEWAAAAAEGRDSVVEYRFVRPDGTFSWIQGFAAALHDEHGTLLGWVGTCVDLTERKLAEQALVVERELFRHAFDDAPIAMALVTPDGRWAKVNLALCELLGYEPSHLLELSVEGITHQDDVTASREHRRRQLEGEVDHGRIEKRFMRADGRLVWIGLTSTLVRDSDGRPLYFVAHIEDVGDRRDAEKRLRRLADHDALTGLLNRRRFGEEVGQELGRIRRNGGRAALLLIDLDHFKSVNDDLGHKAGDEVLAAVARTLRGRLRSTDIAGRLGGDEFAVLLLGTDRPGARQIADDLHAALRSEEISVAGTTVVQTASIGVLPLGPETVGRSDDVIAVCDEAMYEAKRAGRDRVAVAPAWSSSRALLQRRIDARGSAQHSGT